MFSPPVVRKPNQLVYCYSGADPVFCGRVVLEKCLPKGARSAQGHAPIPIQEILKVSSKETWFLFKLVFLSQWSLSAKMFARNDICLLKDFHFSLRYSTKPPLNPLQLWSNLSLLLQVFFVWKWLKKSWILPLTNLFCFCITFPAWSLWKAQVFKKTKKGKEEPNEESPWN